ncbi:hypothetical protein MBLNU459_g1865t1 [Dothideomycetes sp. NU459]
MPSAIDVPVIDKNSNGAHPKLNKRHAIRRVVEAIQIGAPDKDNADFLTARDAKQIVNQGGPASNEFPPEKPYSIALKSVPVTVERLPYYFKEGDRLQDAGTARSNTAPSIEHPHGTTQDDWAKRHQHQTVVQQHVVYWDQDNDGIISVGDTYRGLRDWGWSIPLCLFATFLINVNLSYPSSPSWIPDPFFRIYIANMHKNKHGSDSMSYDNEGRFRPQNFEDIFTKYDLGNKGGLDITDLARFHKGQRLAMDLWGWSASFFEWTAVYLLLWPEDGIMRKDDIRRVFDGSIFQHKADEYAEKQRKQNAERKLKGRPWLPISLTQQ